MKSLRQRRAVGKRVWEIVRGLGLAGALCVSCAGQSSGAGAPSEVKSSPAQAGSPGAGQGGPPGAAGAGAGQGGSPGSTEAGSPQAAPQGGKVLFSRSQAAAVVEGEPEGSSSSSSDSLLRLARPAGASDGLPPNGLPPDGLPLDGLPPDALPGTAVTQLERSGMLISAYSLDVHLTPAGAAEEVHATLTVRNQSFAPLSRLPLQISSSLRWRAVSEIVPGDGSAGGAAASLRRLAFTQSPIATDTDHTGYAQEAVVSLSAPLAAGGSVTISVFYSGEIRRSGARLELLGTAAEEAEESDWDEIAPGSDDSATAVRGFGHVLWYPVVARTVALGRGNELLAEAAGERLRGEAATIRLRLTVEYVGDAPAGAIFDGELRPLAALADDQDALTAEGHGLATVDFPERVLGFRAPSLFLTAEQPVSSEGQVLSVISARAGAADPYVEAAARVQPLLSDWFGVNPLTPLLLLDHAGEPFADDALLVVGLRAEASAEEMAPGLVGPLTHAWIRSSHPWIEQGLAGFLGLLWTERTKGRQAALAELDHQANLVALAEPDLSAAPNAGGKPDAKAGEPLVAASSPVLLGGKAEAVWWQLREMLGEETLRHGLIAYRHAEAMSAGFDEDRAAMEKTLERVSGKDLGWFFDDWVYHDRSLPDLTIVQVNPRALPARPGKSAGYLVAVEVRNEGDAAAEVPVTVRSEGSGGLTATERLRIPARSNASTRIVFEGVPESVEVNDGSTPELRGGVHTFRIAIRP